MTVSELIVVLQKLPQYVKVVTCNYPDSESSVDFVEDLYGATYYEHGLWDTKGIPVVEIHKEIL